jgi:hypothetical protein
MDASVAPLSIPLLGFSEARLKVWWALCEQKGVCSSSPATLKQANGYMDSFMEIWKDDLGFIAVHKSVGSHYTLKKPAVLAVRPSGDVPLNTDEEKAAKEKSLALVQEMEALKVGELVPVGTPMWKMSELTDYWGYYGTDEIVLDVDSVFHQFADILLYMVVGEEAKPKVRSAMARARKLSKTLQTAAIMKHVRSAIKGPEFRQYKTRAEERLSEFTTMIDLDSDDGLVREAAFGAVLPTLILEAQHVAGIFAQQLDDEMVMSGYQALVQHYLPDAKPLEKSTILLLDHKVALPLARCRHETALLDSAEVIKQMILFDMEEQVQQGQALSSVGKAEDEDTAGKGRGLTKGEMSELTLVRSHVLWGTFVSQLAVVRARSSDPLDIVQLQLDSGLPIVRRNFMCMVTLTSHAPWDFLLNHRMAKKAEYGRLQKYMGRELMRDETGVVPDIHQNWLAPLWLIKLLDAGSFSEINFEQLHAEIQEVLGVPLPADDVQWFSHQNRYGNVKYLDEAMELGVTTLVAWGVESEDVFRGSFKEMVTRHKKKLKMSFTLKPEPRRAFLTDEFFGVWPTFAVGMQDAEANFRAFMAMSPSQIMVTGSVTAVTKSLKPFVPEDSQYHKMVERAQEEQALLMKNRRQNPSYYNEGYVVPNDPVDGYNLDNTSSKSSPGKAKSKSVSFGSMGSNSTLRSQGGFSWDPSGTGSWHGGVYTLVHPNVVHRGASLGHITPTVASGGCALRAHYPHRGRCG